VIDLAGGASKKIASEPLYSPRKTIRGSWSPDSRWIAYGLNSLSYIQSVNVYSLEQDKSFAVTDGFRT